MAARGISLHRVPQFPMNLASAAREWFLIFLLFVHAIFSYSITKFARYCKLQVPCLLCSRLDHVWGSEKFGFYWDLICRHHKLEISSLVVCHVHNKLVDVHGMCENCLFSFATINKSNAETYRLLVGKLGEDPQLGCVEDLLPEDQKPGDFSKRICACCNEPLILKNHARDLLQAQLDFDGLKKSRKEPLGSLEGFDPLPYVEYRKVKISSDTESEVPFSDDDDGVSLIHETADRKKGFAVKSVLVEPRIITLGDDLTFKKLVHTDSTSEISLLDSPEQIGNSDPEGSKRLTTNISFRHGLEEISWHNVELKLDSFPAAIPPAASIEGPQSPKVNVTPADESKVCLNGTGTDEVEQMRRIMVTVSETKPVTEQETSTEPIVVNENVVGTFELGQISDAKVINKETKAVVERETSSEIPVAVNENIAETVAKFELTPEINEMVIETSNLEQISNAKAIDIETKVVERETDLEIPSAVSEKATETVADGEISTEINEKITETFELEQKSNTRATDVVTKAVVERDMNSEIASAVDEKVTEKVAMEQLSREKVTGEEKPIVERETNSEILSVVNDANSQVFDNLELGDAYKLAVSNRRQLSGKLLEQRSTKDCTRLSEDFKLLLSQISAARGIDLPFNDFSPRLSGMADEARTDSSSVNGMHLLQRRISLERNESGLSLDGSLIGEIEGENEVDRLKRQVEHDKKLMSALYKELEEERSASSIAANQAMAMITRLQEEKAALQMEALQCVRMMEEQAEYDVEALQKANDLLAEKEKEMQDLEADLEFLRSKLEDAPMFEQEVEATRDLEVREVAAEQSDSNHFRNSENVESNSTVDKPHAYSKDDLTYDLYSEFEEERLYILECLKKLEKKLHLFSNDGVILDAAETVNTRREDALVDVKEPNCKEAIKEISSRKEENDLSERNPEVDGKTSAGFGCGGQCYSRVSRMPNAAAIEDTVSNLINRLEALEADRNDVGHSLESRKREGEELELESGDSLSLQGTSFRD